MKSLFDENDRWTPEANRLTMEVRHLLEPLFKQWAKDGYSVREISHIIGVEVGMIECSTILDKVFSKDKPNDS
jgi:hypothetical protein